MYNNRVGRGLSPVLIMIIERMNMYRKNELIELNITSLTSDGDGVGRAGEMVFFVPNTAVGDTIRAKVLTLPSDTMLIPGHGPSTTVANERDYNPYL